MPIRWKFFLILLAFSVLPLVAVNAIGHHNLLALGDRLAEGAFRTLLNQAERDLARNAEAVAGLLELEAEGLEWALRALAAEAERALNTPEEAALPPPADRPSPPPGEEPVVLAPPGAPPEIWQPEARRLVPVLRLFEHRALLAVNRAYIGLESGLHVAYPAHGGYPPDFDPRQRPWYRAGRENPHLLWLAYPDASTGLAVFTVAIPLRTPGGRFLGVAALDSLPAEVLGTRRLQARWSEDSQVLLAVSGEGPGDLVVVAGDPAALGGAPAAPLDDRSLQDLGRALEARRTGLLEMPFGGRDALWAFAPLERSYGRQATVVVVAPKRVLTAMPEQVQAQVQALTRRMHLIAASVSAGMALLVLLMAFFGSRAATRPITTIVEAWRRLASGDFSVRLNLRSRDERDIVYRAFNETIPKLEAHFQLNRSLDLAREIQQSLLPRQLPHFPGLEVAGASRYCDQTGGDYWDVFATDTADRPACAVLVGDISGHGVAAALLMTTARALIRSLSLCVPDPAARLAQVNRLLHADCAESGSFMTLFYLEIDLTRRQACWIRAGHDPALVYDPDADRFTELQGEGMALGIEPEAAFPVQCLDLDRPGRLVVIGTDGIWEAHNPEGEMYGKERFQQLIRAHAHRACEELREAIFADLAAFTGSRGLDDDVTVALIKVRPPIPMDPQP